MGELDEVANEKQVLKPLLCQRENCELIETHVFNSYAGRILNLPAMD